MIKYDEDFFLFYLKKENSFKYFSKLKLGRLYFQNYYLDLSTGESVQYDYKKFLKTFKSIKVSDYFEQSKIYILLYELGHYFTETKYDLSEVPLAIELEFYQSEVVPNEFKYLETLKFKDIQSIDKNKYEKKFDKVKSHLKKGDCYQVNLTEREIKEYSVSQTAVRELVCGLFRNGNNIGEYAHAFYSKKLKKLILSNSPECLFQRKKVKSDYFIYSMPIKGTVQIEQSVEKAWEKLQASSKDKAELFMISDLIRNDLAKIDKPVAQIIKTREQLNVPGIVHQFSLIQTNISSQTNLYSIVESLFPGGSITGAPKKKVMEIIEDVESTARSFYCGSTIILDKSMMAASINIRTAECYLEKRQIIYGSGGGITIKSEKNSEFSEVLQKISSFFNHFFH